MFSQKWGKHGIFWDVPEKQGLILTHALKLSMFIGKNDNGLGGLASGQIHQVET